MIGDRLAEKMDGIIRNNLPVVRDRAVQGESVDVVDEVVIGDVSRGCIDSAHVHDGVVSKNNPGWIGEEDKSIGQKRAVDVGDIIVGDSHEDSRKRARLKELDRLERRDVKRLALENAVVAGLNQPEVPVLVNHDVAVLYLALDRTGGRVRRGQCHTQRTDGEAGDPTAAAYVEAQLCHGFSSIRTVAARHVTPQPSVRSRPSTRSWPRNEPHLSLRPPGQAHPPTQSPSPRGCLGSNGIVTQNQNQYRSKSRFSQTKTARS